MANLDLDAILPLVTHPIRYTGGELNCISVPGEDKRIRVALLLPDVYEIGMSNYGLRILYALLNRRPDTICERAYTPWPDMANRLRTSGIPLYSLESRRPLNTFHILGFSLQSELTYTNLLYTLELAGVPLHNHERTERHPLVIAGGPCCANPLPLRDFIDCFVIGDGEDVIQEIVATYRDWNRSHRADLLAALAQLESVYVPLVPARTPIRRRVKAVLSEAEFPFPPIVPIGEIIHDRLTLEIARGCCRGCRFCQAGVLNRPYRTRPQAELVRLAEKGIQASGWEEVSLLSLSALDYPGLLDLVDRLNSSLEKRRVAISLPSVRGEDFTPELAQALKKVHKTGLTFAPETASPRLRQMVNKDISEQKIIDSIQAAAQAGWTGVKLYFMIGLPGETDADVNEIGRFVEELGRIAKTWQVRFNLSPFVPKPHTPLQWCGFAPVAALAERLGRLRSGLRRRNVRAKWERPEVSCLQTALARGDTRLGPVIERAYRLGGIFQEWTEDFSFELWQRAFRDSGIDLDSYLRPLPLDQPLPWDFIDVGVSKEHLRAEHDRAQAGLLTPDCRPSECWACGIVNCPGTGRTEPTAKSSVPPATGSAEIDYGRYRRKLLPDDQLRTRFRLRYAKEEPFRYAGHLDIIRAFYRALRRSDLPVAYSQGFAPRPVIAFGPPLPVGVTSNAEYLDLQMAGHYLGNLVRDLGSYLPPGLRLLESRQILAKSDSLGASIKASEYRILTRGLQAPEHSAALERRAAIPGILDLKFAAPDALSSSPADSEAGYDPVEVVLVLAVTPGAKLFPTLARLFNLTDPEVRCWRIQRRACYTVRADKLVSPMEEL